MTAPALSVLVPVVERADDLRTLHAAFEPPITSLGRDYEFLYLVSREFEDAFQQAMELHERDPEHVRVVRFGQPVGEAGALAVGFQRARGELILTMPAYFDAEPGGVTALAAALDKGADLAFASRTGRRDRPAKRLQSAVFNRLASWATGTRFRDLASATRAVRREVLAELPLYGDFHRFLPVLAHQLGFAVEEVPVPQDLRAAAPAVYRPRVYLWRLLDILSVFFLTRFTRRPLRLFGAVGTLFGLLGATIVLVVGVQRLLGQPLAERPVLVLGILLLGLGVQAFTVGLLGELLLFFHAREIPEYRLAEVHEAAPAPLPERAEPKH